MATKPAATPAPAAAAAPPVQQATVQVVKRISLGSLWATSNERFMSGKPRPSDGIFANQTLLLSILPPAPEGYQWQLKAFRSKSTSEKAPQWDLCLELEEIYTG